MSQSNILEYHSIPVSVVPVKLETLKTKCRQAQRALFVCFLFFPLKNEVEYTELEFFSSSYFEGPCFTTEMPTF